MSESTNPAYEEACNEYRRLMREYAEALEAKAPTAPGLLADADAAWLRISAIAPDGLEAQAGTSMHLSLAYSYACGAGDGAEAERLYNEMSDEDRRMMDEADARDPGSMKLWLRK